jgi:hypothetical protein
MTLEQADSVSPTDTRQFDPHPTDDAGRTEFSWSTAGWRGVVQVLANVSYRGETITAQASFLARCASFCRDLLTPLHSTLLPARLCLAGDW